VNAIIKYIHDNGGTIGTALLNLLKTLAKSDLVRKIGETFATKIMLIGLGLITGVITARILGPEGRGLYAVAITVATMGIQFGNLGLHASNTYYVAKDRSQLPVLVGNSLFISIIFGVFAALAWITFRAWPSLAPISGRLLVLTLAWIPVGLAYMLLQNILLGIEEFRAYNKIELVMQFLSIVAISTLIVFRAVSVESIFLTAFLTLFASAGWAFFHINKYYVGLPLFSASLFKNNLHFGVKAYMASFFAFLVLRSDLLIVKYIRGSEEAGLYSIAVSLADMVYLLPTVIATILFPKLSSMSDKNAKWILLKKTIWVSAPFLSIVGLCATLLASFIISFLFGKAYTSAAPAFVWLMPGILFLGIQVIAVQLLNSEGFPKIIVAIWAVSFLFNIGLNLYAVPKFGMIGASIASSLSYFLVLSSVAVVIRRAVHE